MALDASTVIREIEIFGNKDSGRIIPIDFGGTIRVRNESKQIFKHLAEDLLYIEELPLCLVTGPSDNTVSKLNAGFNLTRQESKRASLFGGIAVIFMVLGMLAIVAGLVAHRNSVISEANALEAKKNLIKAYTIQSAEMAGQGLQSEEAAYLTAALGLSDYLGGPLVQRIQAELSSLIGSGKFPVLIERLEHSGSVNGATFSRTGKYLITWSTSADLRTARLWKFENGKAKAIGNPMPVNWADEPVAFSQDETTIAIASEKSIQLRRTEDGTPLREPIAIGWGARLVVFNNTGNYLLAVSDSEQERSVVVVDAYSGNVMQNLSSFHSIPTVSPFGQYASFEGNIVTLSPPFETRSLPYEASTITRTALRYFSSDRFAFVNTGNNIEVLDTTTLERLRCIDERSSESISAFRYLAASEFSVGNQGEFLLIQKNDGTGVETFESIVASFKEPEESPVAEKGNIKISGIRNLYDRMIQLSPSGHLLACASDKGTVQLRDTDTNFVISNGIRHPNPVERVIFSPDEHFLLTIANDEFLRVWRIDLLRDPSRPKAMHLPVRSNRWIPNCQVLSEDYNKVKNEEGDFTIAATSNDGKWTLTFRGPDEISMFDVGLPASWLTMADATGRSIWRKEIGRFGCVKLGFSNDGTLFHVLVLSPDRLLPTTMVGNTASGEILFSVPGFIDGYDSAGRWIVYSLSGFEFVKNVKTGAIEAVKNFPGGWVTCVAFSPNGKYLALGFKGGASSPPWAGVWNLEGGDRIMSCNHDWSNGAEYLSNRFHIAHGVQGMTYLTFSPDSNYLATLSAREEIGGDRSKRRWQPRQARVWEVATGRPVGGGLQLNGSQYLADGDKVGLLNSAESTESYVRPLSMKFSSSGEELLFHSGGQLFQEWNLAPKIKREDLVTLAEVLSGFRYDAAQAQLVSLPEEDRISRWRILSLKESVVKLLELDSRD